MKYQEIKEMEEATLNDKLEELRRSLFELKVEKYMKKQAGGIKKSHEFKTQRRDVARILTLLNSRKVQQVGGA